MQGLHFWATGGWEEEKLVFISKACFVSVLQDPLAICNTTVRKKGGALLAQSTQVLKLIKQQLTAQLTLAPLANYPSGNPSYNLFDK